MTAAPPPTTASAMGPQTPTAFALVQGASAFVLPALYFDSGFHRATDAYKRFAAGQMLIVGSASSLPRPVRVDSVIDDPDSYDPNFVLAQSFPGDGYYLAWTPDTMISIISPDTIAPPAALRALIPAVVDSLWRVALRERPGDDQPDGAPSIGPLTVLTVPQEPHTMLAFFRLPFREGSRVDDRGSVFLVYSPVNRRITYAVFGHPEWAPVADSHLLIVQPYVFFQVAGDTNVYFAGNREGSWESMGAAIYYVATGQTVGKR